MPSSRPWQLHRPRADAASALGASLGLTPVLGQLLLNRDLDTPAAARHFLDAPAADVRPPEELPGAVVAAARLAAAVRAGWPICVYGDYDVDGTTGSAILWRTLRRLGGRAQVYVPHRLVEGYGLNPRAVAAIARAGFRLLVTVDCGVTALDEVAAATAAGLEVVVTDHHEPRRDATGQPRWPGGPGVTLVHPRVPDSAADPHLCGAAVAMKVAWALVRDAAGAVGPTACPDAGHLAACRALAAVGTVADVVPLRGENRALVRDGLRHLTGTSLPGLRAALDVAGVAGSVAAEDVAYRLGPRFNAAGRLGCARQVVDLLTTEDARTAGALAEYVDHQNRVRQHLERAAADEAYAQSEAAVYHNAPALVLASTRWHPGVVGIVAGRLVERFHKPALVVALGAQLGLGSGRSPPGLALHEALAACTDYLVSHGGHAAAAGFKVLPEHLAGLREAFVAYAHRHYGGVPAPVPLRLEAEARLGDCTRLLVDAVARLEPYGAGNPRPLFFLRGCTAGGVRVIGKDGTHLAFSISQDGLGPMRCVAFGMATRLRELLGGRVDLAAAARLNDWQGRQSVELEVKDFRDSKN